MRHSIYASSLLAVFVAASAVALNLPQASKLRVKPAADKPYIIKTTSNSVTELSGMMTQTIKADVTSTQKLTFGAATDGWSKATLENQEATFKTDAEIPGMDATAAEKALKEMAFEMEVSEKGEVRNYKMIRGNKEDMMMASMLNQGQDIMTQVGLNGISYPDDEVAVGTKWSKVVDITKIMNDNSMGMMTAKDAKMPMAYEVTAIKMVDGKSVAEIKLTSDTTIELELAIPGAEGPGKVKMVTDSLFTVDLESGMVVKIKSTITSVSDFGIITVNSKSTSDVVVTQ